MLYSSLIRPALFSIPPERVHHFSMGVLTKTPLADWISPWCRPKQGKEVVLWGIRFPHVMGLAAGFDKEASGICIWEKLGFAFAELGTITRYGQVGNPKPRVFRVPSHGGLINRMGFPNPGADYIADQLKLVKDAGNWPSIPIGINIGKSKVTELEDAAEDYLYSYQKLYEYADYVAVNVSSPNTPGLRNLQGKKDLVAILKMLHQHVPEGKEAKPILVKIAPDLTESQIGEVLECISETGTHGVIATNTTIDKSSVPLKEEGGLSGRPVRERSTQVIQFISKETEGKLPVMGVGGIFTEDDVKEKLDAGASLVQAYTGFIYQGPTFCRQVVDGA